ncbi:MAG TPA: heme-binding protein [Bacteroidales bacterium]|nr:heme-binding protein [Bacteroidales bacterium]
MAEEPLKYEVLLKKDNVELRHYKKALIATVAAPGDLFSERNSNFSRLADYIFGGNQNSEKIGMTSPVIMNTSADSTEMHFIMPDRYSKEDLPNPENKDIRIQEFSSFYAVAVTFGGYANESKYQQYVEEIKTFAKDKNLKHANEFMLLGYDPPFKVINRKNEILLKLTEAPDI